MLTPLILVVEDNPKEQYVLSQLITLFDYAVESVASGEQAIEVTRRKDYAAILMDLTLPGIDGLECARRLRAQESYLGRKTPIIALTARVRDDDRDNCLEAGMDDHMIKPFEPEELRKMLLRYVYIPSSPNLKTLTPLPQDEVQGILKIISEEEEELPHTTV